MNLWLASALGAAVGLLIGLALAWLERSKRVRLLQEHAALKAKLEELDQQKETLLKAQKEAQQLASELAAERARRQTLEEAHQRRAEELAEIQQRLGERLELVSRQVLEAREKALVQKGGETLEKTVAPVREEFARFREQLARLQKDVVERHTSLDERIRHLMEESRRLGEEAERLARALKGEAKAQGDWGEVVLTRLLELAGLREGEEFETQQAFTRKGEEGAQRLRPDVIVHLPEGKTIVIDAKVSLLAYERAVNAESEQERADALKAHLESVRRHIEGLKARRYHDFPGATTPEFTLMFIPIEGAYLAALEADRELFVRAFEERIVVVTPATLYATLRLIAQLWRHAKQEAEVTHVVQEMGKLYDKLIGFLNAFDEIGKNLQKAEQSYLIARKRLVDGRGNAIDRILNLKKFVGGRKGLPKGFSGDESE